MFHLIGFILFGLVVGLLARALMPGRDEMSLPATTLLGIAGALIAGWLGRALGWYGPQDGAGFIVSTIGAVLLIAIYNATVKRRGGVVRHHRNDRDFPSRAA